MSKLVVVVAAVVAFAGCFTPGAPSAGGDVAASLESSKSSFTADEAIALDLVLENTTDAPIRVLSYRTPFDGIEDNIFAVTRDGVPVAYEGKVVKRAQPEADDYIV